MSFSLFYVLVAVTVISGSLPPRRSCHLEDTVSKSSGGGHAGKRAWTDQIANQSMNASICASVYASTVQKALPWGRSLGYTPA